MPLAVPRTTAVTSRAVTATLEIGPPESLTTLITCVEMAEKKKLKTMTSRVFSGSMGTVGVS